MSGFIKKNNAGLGLYVRKFTVYAGVNKVRSAHKNPMGVEILPCTVQIEFVKIKANLESIPISIQDVGLNLSKII
ncbi:hypothetical protein CE91St36_23620 [Christensenellaceae bacterium]|nr:hypothetical protein CE91St36_23620 [Christensenellaceae bacterium]